MKRAQSYHALRMSKTLLTLINSFPKASHLINLLLAVESLEAKPAIMLDYVVGNEPIRFPSRWIVIIVPPDFR